MEPHIYKEDSVVLSILEKRHRVLYRNIIEMLKSICRELPYGPDEKYLRDLHFNKVHHDLQQNIEKPNAHRSKCRSIKLSDGTHVHARIRMDKQKKGLDRSVEIRKTTRFRCWSPNSYIRIPAGASSCDCPVVQAVEKVPISPQPNAPLQARRNAYNFIPELIARQMDLPSPMFSLSPTPCSSDDEGLSSAPILKQDLQKRDAATQVEADVEHDDATSTEIVKLHDDSTQVGKSPRPKPAVSHHVQFGKHERNHERHTARHSLTEPSLRFKRPTVVVRSPLPRPKKILGMEVITVDRGIAGPQIEDDNPQNEDEVPQQKQEPMSAVQDCPTQKEVCEQIKQLQHRFGRQELHVEELYKEIRILQQRCDALDINKTADPPEPPKNASAQLPTQRSSLCQFCGDKEQPVVTFDLHVNLISLMEKREFKDVVLTVLLRADNIYHINMRDMATGKSLGCALATDKAVEQAIELGLFEAILTFCVIDMRNTLKPCKKPLGITFEFVKQPRKSGGYAASGVRGPRYESATLCTKTLVAKELGVAVDDLRMIYPLSEPIKLIKTKENLSVSLTEIAIAAIDSKYVLTDDDDKYMVRNIYVSSFTTSDHSSEVFICSSKELDMTANTTELPKTDKLKHKVDPRVLVLKEPAKDDEEHAHGKRRIHKKSAKIKKVKGKFKVKIE